MDGIVHTHAILAINTLIEVKTKNQVQLELEMYFDQLMHIVTSGNLDMRTNTMHRYVVAPASLKTMMRMLSDELHRGVKSVYPDATETRVRFQKDFTTNYMDTIIDYQSWHQFATINHREYVKELVFP